ncbi:MAG: sigma-70 family RNA polymerase sigma factor [Leptolinea sp.]
MNHRSETDLLQGARNLNAGILAEIYDLYSPALFAYAYRQLGDAPMAEDCVSETFTRFLKALQSGAGPSDHLKAYLYRIAHNWLTDLFRREPFPFLELDENFTTQADNHLEIQIENNLAIHDLRSALRSLTSDQRQVIVLRFIEGWETDQVAAAMQRPIGAIKALQHRALAALRKMLVLVEV